MSRSVLNKWWPVTYDFGLIKAPVKTVLQSRHRTYLDHGLDNCTRQNLNRPLDWCLRTLEPLSFQHTKELYLSTTFGWTALFQNGTRGSDPFLPMMQLSKALRVCAMRICVSPAKSKHPAVIWEVYDVAENGGDKYGYRRSIAAANDGGRWVFVNRGDPFSFEELDRYSTRRKRDRFPAELLWRYLHEMGIPQISDSDFLNGDVCKGGVIARPKVDGAQHMSLEEAIIAY